MAAYWTSTDTGLRDVARAMNSLPKCVISSTLHEADWRNSTTIRGPLKTSVADSKQESPGALLVLGGARLTVRLLKAGLFNELRLMENPVALDRGVPVLGALKNRRSFRLKTRRVFESGNVRLTHEPHRTAVTAGGPARSTGLLADDPTEFANISMYCGIL
jgi:dihydrofolate reductase